MRSTKKATILAAVGLIVGLLAVPGTAQLVTCPVADTSVEEVVEAVTLEWTSSFLCSDVPTDPSSGEFHIEGSVVNLSDATVSLSALALAFTTPPGSSGSITSADFAASFGPGSTHTFTATGTYQMVETDEGFKVNLHLRGAGDVGGEPFALGTNVHVRGIGATEDGDGGDDGDEGDDGGPPDFGDWQPGSGPPPFAGAPSVGTPAATEATVTISEVDTPTPPEEEQEEIEDDEGPRWLRDDAEGWTPGTPSPPPWAGDDGDGEPPFMRHGSTDWKPGDGPPDWAPPGGGGDDEPEEEEPEDAGA